MNLRRVPARLPAVSRSAPRTGSAGHRPAFGRDRRVRSIPGRLLGRGTDARCLPVVGDRGDLPAGRRARAKVG